MDKQAMENAIDRVKVLYMELSRTLNVPKEGRWIPRSIDEARLVLRELWSLCDALCELIRLAERESKAWSREVAQVVAYPIGYLFMVVDEVVYAWYSELAPEELKEEEANAGVDCGSCGCCCRLRMRRRARRNLGTHALNHGNPKPKR